MVPFQRAAVATLFVAFSIVPLTHSYAEEADAESLVNGLNAVFGAHKGVRAAHPHGFCVKGNFAAAPEAATLTKAQHFNSKTPVGVVARFSIAGGNPKASNATNDFPRGFAIHFDLGHDTTTDLVMISAPVFNARDPDQFLKLLTTVATHDTAKIGEFFKENPNTTLQAQWLKTHPVPASFATVDYWGVHAFTATNAEGKKQVFKYKAIPIAGDVGLSEAEAKTKDFDFYRPELKDRLAKGPIQFKLTAILGQPGDPTNDPTAMWPEDQRKSLTLGTLSITGLEDYKTCDAGIFDPTVLTDGIDGPANDTIFPMRSQAYAVSFSRRAAP